MKIPTHSSTCWQHQLKKQNYQSDLKENGLTPEEAESLVISDLTFSYIPKEDASTCKKISLFINRHEWLGKMPHRPTHRFIATYKGHIAGVVIMATPYTFSFLLGKENTHLEKLISRGASISWAPKNLGSWMIMKSVQWMIHNTHYRYFTAYSDPRAGELGTIYQSCNFIYLGNKSGARFEYFDKNNPGRGWFSDRLFRKVGQYKKYAQELGIEWRKSWCTRTQMNWQSVPSLIAHSLRTAAYKYQDRCERRKVPSKHKYLYIKGNSKSETKRLLKLFQTHNPRLCHGNRIGLEYPTVRGA